VLPLFMGRTSKESRLKYYYSHKESEIKRIRNRRFMLRDYFKELKSHLKCTLCSENAIECLDFHHLNPEEKEGGIPSMINSGCSKERILIEIKKCVVLCSNCHKKVHSGRIIL